MRKFFLFFIILAACAVGFSQEYNFSNSIPVWVESHRWEKSVTATGYTVRQFSLNYLNRGGIQIRVTAEIYELDGTVSKKTFTVTTEQAAIALGSTNALADIQGVFSVAVGRMIESGAADGQDWK